MICGLQQRPLKFTMEMGGEAAQVREGPILTWVLKDEQAFLG